MFSVLPISTYTWQREKRRDGWARLTREGGEEKKRLEEGVHVGASVIESRSAREGERGRESEGGSERNGGRGRTSSASFFFLRSSFSFAVGARCDEAIDPKIDASPPTPAGACFLAAAFLVVAGFWPACSSVWIAPPDAAAPALPSLGTLLAAAQPEGCCW